MKAKNWCVLCMVLAVSLAGFAAVSVEEETEKIELLQKRIEELEKVIESQHKIISITKEAYEQQARQLDEQIRENERLKALCKEAGILSVTIKKARSDTGDIVYRGKKRNQKWLDETYEKFCDKIVYWDGKYIDIGEHLGFHYITPSDLVWPIGTPVQFYPYSKVISVLKKGEVLISNVTEYGQTNVTVHVHKLDGIYVDGQIFPADILRELIYTGIFEYVTFLGRKMTVPSLTPYRPLTKEQFTEAVDSGIELVEYEEVIKDKQGRIYRKKGDNNVYYHSDGSAAYFGGGMIHFNDLVIKKDNIIVERLSAEEWDYEIIGKPIR